MSQLSESSVFLLQETPCLPRRASAAAAADSRGRRTRCQLRLLYNRPGQSQTQTPRDELTTRIRASGPSSAQVCDPWRRDSRTRPPPPVTMGDVWMKKKKKKKSCLFFCFGLSPLPYSSPSSPCMLYACMYRLLVVMIQETRPVEMEVGQTSGWRWARPVEMEVGQTSRDGGWPDQWVEVGQTSRNGGGPDQ